MNDFGYLAILVVFFGLAALFVLACNRIIGADEETAPPPAPARGAETETTDLAA